MSKIQNKNQFIQVRVSQSEKDYILKNAEQLEMTVSDYMRHVCLQYTLHKSKSQSQQLRLLASLSSNINQIARHVNIYKNNINKLRLLLCLMHFEEEITGIRKCI